MLKIQVLDQITIDKIAAGEVIERPASVVKELVENAIDAKASSVTVEIKDGGISLIRISDNGCGIPREDVPYAFLRHSTSKIRNVEDLLTIDSLGFRGEALSSIAAVTKTELITKTKEDVFGTKYVIEGGQEISMEDVGAPDGTTFLVHQLFYNVPARRKFLKTSMTEAGHIQELLMHLALSHPEVSFKFISNNQEKLRTSGNGNLKDVIYSIYGREIAANLIEIDYSQYDLHIKGYLGKPVINRSNRNFENFFVNGRYVKSSMLSKAVEDGYRDFVMQHKFPFVVLHFQIEGEEVDVNVHPTKMELRFQNQQRVYQTVFEAVQRTLLEPELIPVVDVPDPLVKMEEKPQKKESPFLLKPKANPQITPVSDVTLPLAENKFTPVKMDEEYFLQKMKERVYAEHEKMEIQRSAQAKQLEQEKISEEQLAKRDYVDCISQQNILKEASDVALQPEVIKEHIEYNKKPEQMNLFEEHLLKREVKAEYKLIGQVFDTYWLVEFNNSLYIIDQHAAHERVLYERTLKEMKNRTFTSQYLSPPIILSLSMREAQLLEEHMDRFASIGFEIEPFGGDEYAVRAVPDNLFSIAKKELLLEMLDDMADGLTTSMTPEVLDEKVASMSCKAAVKGNNRLSAIEADTLIGELLTLDNPYHCPHGRPTIIAMTKRELEKKFKRIV